MHKSIAAWLLGCCALVFAMVVVGGVTRLTESGLSIVEWQPLIGTIPPLGQNDWEALFEKYHQTPQYKKVNVGMSLDEPSLYGPRHQALRDSAEAAPLQG